MSVPFSFDELRLFGESQSKLGDVIGTRCQAKGSRASFANANAVSGSWTTQGKSHQQISILYLIDELTVNSIPDWKNELHVTIPVKGEFLVWGLLVAKVAKPWVAGSDLAVRRSEVSADERTWLLLRLLDRGGRQASQALARLGYSAVAKVAKPWAAGSDLAVRR